MIQMHPTMKRKKRYLSLALQLCCPPLVSNTPIDTNQLLKAAITPITHQQHLTTYTASPLQIPLLLSLANTGVLLPPVRAHGTNNLLSSCFHFTEMLAVRASGCWLERAVGPAPVVTQTLKWLPELMWPQGQRVRFQQVL